MEEIEISKEPKENGKYRNWCGTIFYDQRESVAAAFNGLYSSGKISYAICGFEVCPTTGREHGQWFIRFRSQRYFGGVRGLLPYGAHVEPCKGTISDNIIYCSKSQDFMQWGNTSTQRKDNFYKTCKAALQGGHTMVELVSGCASVAEIKQVEYMSKYFTADKIPPHVIWVWGPSGSGKTSFAMSMPGSKFIKEPGHKWFDGYAGEDVCIFDDLRITNNSWPDFPTLLRLLDSWPVRVEIKHGTIPFNPKIIIVTSIFSPEDSCPSSEDNKQLLRRIHEIKKM